MVERHNAFYDRTYGGFTGALQSAIRDEAFGEQIGQNSWLTVDEHRKYFDWLGVQPSEHVLEIGSGSGGPALHMVRTTGCRVTGIDLHSAGVAAGNAMAAEQGLAVDANFLVADARERLPFDDRQFDRVICIDSIHHVFDRAGLLAECFRTMRPGGRLLFTDPITVTGMLTRDEMIIRSEAMGDFAFTPLGVDEDLLRDVGFINLVIHDVTDNMADVAARRCTARESRRVELDRVEGAEVNAGYQRYLSVVHLLAAQRRLSRLAYVADTPC